ncbi:uncharacterized protein [Prorops nasuta]|uniref:uncharacterized protein n=1 Tax=Prorops nasuta TaxID=863751 RepID=UPI0034CD264C
MCVCMCACLQYRRFVLINRGKKSVVGSWQKESSGERYTSSGRKRRKQEEERGEEENSNDMTIDFYYFPPSPPCRPVLLLAKAIGVHFNLKPVNPLAGETRTPEFLKMNPQHTVPTIDDNGFYLWESHAIVTYLAEKYGQKTNLYPSDVKQRGLINQRLYFDLGVLYQAFADYYYPIFFAGAPKDQAKYEKAANAVGFLDKFLEGENYVAGKNLTIADLVLVATVSTYELVGFDLSKNKNVVRWLAKIKAEAPKYEEINEDGLKAFKALIDKLAKKQQLFDMVIDCYYIVGSPPCRAVMLAAAALDLEINMIKIHTREKEHLTPKFLKINPLHNLPTLVDGDFVLTESRAIMIYLAENYGKDDGLYPKEIKARALVNCRLFFDISTLFPAFNEYYHPILFQSSPPNPAAFSKVERAMEKLETILTDVKYIAGDKMTLADLAALSTVSTFELVNFDFTPYPNIDRWLQTMKLEAPKYKETNEHQLDLFKKILEQIRESKTE